MVASAFAANREISLLLDAPALAATLSAFLEQDFAGGIALAAAPVALEDGTTVGQGGSAVMQPASGPPAFTLLFATGAGVILASFLGPLIGRRARRRTRPPPRGDGEALSLLVEPGLAETPPGLPPNGGPPASDHHEAHEPAAPSRETAALPPTAFDLFGGR